MEALQTTTSATPDEIWAILRENAIGMKELKERQEETARQMKETDRRMKETDRRMKETDRQMKETDRQMKETDRQMKETDRQMKEYNRRFGNFTNRFGEVVEYMIAPNLQDKFDELGLWFEEVSKRHKFINKKNNLSLEIDYFLENGDKAVLVEVKTNLEKSDVNDHIKRLEKMRKIADLRSDKRSFLGAVAGVVMTDEVKNYALEQGFFVIQPSGETFNITQPDGKPKEW